MIGNSRPEAGIVSVFATIQMNRNLRLSMGDLEWHSDSISENTRIDSAYRNTQNVRRFFKSICGDHFKFDRSFMLWMKENTGKTMDDAVAEWLRRQANQNQIG
jgi:hypothetical protein